jgi:predicted nucleic acid-binding protein
VSTKYDYVLDTSAILALILAEPEAASVVRLLESARDSSATIAVPFLALMETEYKLLRQVSAEDADVALQVILQWPVDVVESHEPWRRAAARVKAGGGLSVADAWMASLALISDAQLLHKDPEFDAVPELRSERL